MPKWNVIFEKEGLTSFSMQSDGTCLYTANGTIYRLSDGTSQMIAAAGEDESNDATTSATLYEPRLTAPTPAIIDTISATSIFFTPQVMECRIVPPMLTDELMKF